MIQNLEKNSLVVSAERIDIAFYSPDEILMARRNLILLNQAGYGFHRAMRLAELEDHHSPEALHAVCSLLNSEFENARAYGETSRAVVAARMYNQVGQAARKLQKTSLHPFDETHLVQLEEAIRESMQIECERGNFDAEQLATAAYRAARDRTHWNSWASRLLPSRPGQPYASLALFSVPGEDFALPATWITQIAMFGGGMFSHAHGLSTALSTPLGDPKKNPNTHVNIIWRLHSDTQAFPLHAVNGSQYTTANVALVPPRWIHNAFRIQDYKSRNQPSLAELSQDRSSASKVIDEADFGLSACLHIYRPTRDVVEKYSDIPFQNVWAQTGMLAFDHKGKAMYLGNRHAMEKRMFQLRQGKCCGLCTRTVVEDDWRRVVNLQEIRPFIYSPQPTETIPVWTFSKA